MSFDFQWQAEIPPIFQSVEFDGPFQKCLICNREFYHDDHSPYVIEKIFVRAEAIVEMAVCLNCLMEMNGEMSEESSLTVKNEFEKKVDWSHRASLMPSIANAPNSLEEDEEDPSSEVVAPQPNVERWIESCLLDGTPRQDCRNYQICGLFLGNQIVLGQLPYVLSGTAVARIGEKLSKKTRDQMGDFLETYFGMPPELCSPSGPVPVLF